MQFVFSPSIDVVDDIILRESPRNSLNRLCNLVDWETWGPLSSLMTSLGESVSIHRKAWEYAMCLYGLERFGAIKPESRALSVGAGTERILYYLANHIRLMVATDIYDDASPEGRRRMLTSPEDYSPFPYRNDHLQVFEMPGHELNFPSSGFDFVFSLSSIEHFGTRDVQAKSLAEMRRVVKPGGIVAITTELILNDATHCEYFSFPELEAMFLRVGGMELVGGELDLRIAESLVRYPTMLDVSKNVNVAPHIVLYSEAAKMLFTSVSLFLRRVR